MLHFLKLEDFFNSSGHSLGPDYFVDVINFYIRCFGELEVVNVFLGQAILFLVFYLQPRFLVGCKLITRVNDHTAILACDSFLGHVVQEHLVDVNMEPHEASQALLADNPLQLQVAQGDVL